ncbi:MAG: threonylcarbamoyl-AMP synthase [Lachnospiraceae bacterium]|nr:threonylcarbamoyl-AMP synthase [Lachnospiraceae bacterium]
METKIVDANKELLEFDAAAKCLKEGGLVAFPTETVYGLGGNALNPNSSKKIYEAKGRPSDNPLIVHICDIKTLDKICKEVCKEAYILAERFWPGQLTMVLNKSDIVPYETTGGLDTVAVRMPDNKVALALIDKAGGFVAAPSANVSGKPSPTKAEHVYNDMKGRIEYIVDGGEVGIGIESTIVDLTSKVPTILRPGYITKQMLEEVLETARYDKAILEENAGKDLVPKAPGMKYKHYAPNGELTIVSGNPETVVDKINTLVENNIKCGYKTGVIATDETVQQYRCNNVISLGTRKDKQTLSHNLYNALREFDNMEVLYIYSEDFGEDEFGQAIMNRLLKAAGYKRIEV